MEQVKNCKMVAPKTPRQAIEGMAKLAGMIRQPGGLGAWEGELRSKMTGNVHVGPHLAVFNHDALLALFGPLYDQETEASAALFATALQYAQDIKEYIDQLEGGV